MPRWQQSLRQTEQLVAATGIELVRFAWCDLHGILRGKTLVASAAGRALREGVGMVSTLMLKDTSDRTAFNVFEPGGAADLPGFEFASNLLLMPDPASFRQLPWTPVDRLGSRPALVPDGEPVELDTRRVLRGRSERLPAPASRCSGLEIEFYIYRIDDAHAQLDPQLAAWPGLPPAVAMIHPGYNLLNEGLVRLGGGADAHRAANGAGAGAALLSLEIELGPSRWRRCSKPPTRWPPPTTWCCSAMASGRRCSAPATTPPSGAARPFPASCPAAGTCTSR